MEAGSKVMRRMARPAAPPPSLTPARAFRLAVTRAAERSIGLPLAVLGVAEEEGLLDDLLSRLEEGLLLLSLSEGDAVVGFVALDAEARAAAVEIQTLGRVSSTSPDDRAITAADIALARPLLSAVVMEVGVALAGTVLSDWVRAPAPAGRLSGAREAAVLLPDGRYRVVRLTLDLGAGGRQGLLLLQIRLPSPEPEADAPKTPEATVATQVMAAHAPIEAVLHRLRISLAEAESLELGQVIALPGVTVASVRIEASGRDLGPARLGQVAGMRAIRFEAPLAPRLDDIPMPRDSSRDLRLLTETGQTKGADAADL